MKIDAQGERRRMELAVGYFTRIPVSALADESPEALGRSARYLPAVGLLVGLLSALALWLAAQIWPTGAAVLLSMSFSLLLTGALHEDGLADAADGFGGGFERERVLRIMKDSRIGSFGAIALLLSLTLKFALLSALANQGLALALAVLLVAHTVSRCAALSVMLRLDYQSLASGARARPFADSVGITEWRIGAATGGLVLTLVCLIGGISLAALLAVVGGVAAATWGCMAYFRSRIGGYTGDCLGATQQVTEIVIYLAVTAVMH
ncbi:MAG: adenosylcobinamide-GDP ribazoletransferase [Panacagrimonas sp.]